MKTLDDVNLDKQNLIQELDNIGVYPAIGTSKNLEGDYILEIRISDSKENVTIVENLIQEKFKDLKYNIRFIGKVKTL
jgi:hypothetical protein